MATASWDPPAAGSDPQSYEVVRSTSPDSVPSMPCLVTTALSADDDSAPLPGQVIYFTARAANCFGTGTTGTGTGGAVRPTGSCP